MTLITVREGAKLKIPPELAGARLPQRLLRLSEGAPIEIFRRCRGGALQVLPVVGTVTCGTVRIEIWPKTASDDSTHDRTFLLNLLRFVGYLKKYHVSTGGVSEVAGSPIEILIGEIADDILNRLCEGIPRRYEFQDIESNTIRGRIDFGRLSRMLPTQQIQIPVRHASLSIDNRLSRMIKWVAQTLLEFGPSARNEEKLLSIVALLRDIDLAEFSGAELEDLSLSRFEARWERTLTIGRLLLQGRSINPTTAGPLGGITLVFKLHGLFEYCLRTFLPAALESHDVSVTHKNKEHFMLQSTRRKESVVPLNPDFVYRRNQTPVAVADTKWKLLEEGKAGYGIEARDLYQAHAYMSRYGVHDTLLLFPRTAWMSEDWSESYRIPDTHLKVHLLGVDIAALVSPDENVSSPALARLTTTIAPFIPAVGAR